jgi:hypothetical protein
MYNKNMRTTREFAELLVHISRKVISFTVWKLQFGMTWFLKNGSVTGCAEKFSPAEGPCTRAATAASCWSAGKATQMISEGGVLD